MGGREPRDVRLVSGWFYQLMLLLLRRPIQHFFRLNPVNTQVIPRGGAAILVANHVTLFDPIWIYDVLKRPVYFVATEELFRGRLLGWLLRWFGAFPKRKAASDLKTMKNVIQILHRGGLVGLYPEGVRTWDGTNGPLIPTIAHLIRRMKVPIFSCRLEGGYLSWPRWADHWRRIPVSLVFNQLYQKNSIPSSEQQILSDIAREIEIRDYQLAIDDPGRRFTGLAAGLPKVLYRCPNCHTVEGLSAIRPQSSNQIECRSCFSAWRVDIGSRATPVDEHGQDVGTSRTVAELYRQIREMPLTPIRTHLLKLEEEEKLYLVSRAHFLFRERRFPRLRLYAFGRALLTDRRLLFKGKAGIRLSAPLSEVDSLSIEPGDKLHFTYRDTLYRIPFRRESPLKWMDMLQRLREPAPHAQAGATAPHASAGATAPHASAGATAPGTPRPPSSRPAPSRSGR
jgi:1-acyl-sn-glycerol-3-phosphate acyltransferase